MAKHHYATKVEMLFETESPALPSKVLAVRVGLDVSPSLVRSAYLDHDSQLTRTGTREFTSTLLMGIVSAAKRADKLGWVSLDEQYEHIGREMARLFTLAKTTTAEFFPDDWSNSIDSERAPEIEKTILTPKFSSTSQELVTELLERNKDGRYDDIIKKARAYWFHDFKQPDDVLTPPKMLLVSMLTAFPELEDIRQAVCEGKYDEQSDEEDRRQHGRGRSGKKKK